MLDIPNIPNVSKEGAGLADLLKGADAFIGVSVGGILKKAMIGCMAKKPIIMAMANPEPEIMPEEALAAGCAINRYWAHGLPQPN